jgi:hypothetical protein
MRYTRMLCHKKKGGRLVLLLELFDRTLSTLKRKDYCDRVLLSKLEEDDNSRVAYSKLRT